jgi:hypothetical protein
MTSDAPIEWLAVLAADGSDASIDALIPHLVTALDKRDQRLDQLWCWCQLLTGREVTQHWPSDAMQLVSWLEDRPAILGVTWGKLELEQSNLRGKKRERLSAWLTRNR